MESNQQTSPLNQIKKWFQDAVPTPTEKSLKVQMGVHFEEVHEMLEAIGEKDKYLFNLSEFLKKGKLSLRPTDDLALLDSLCDQIVTAIGVAHMKGYDITGALQEVAASNDSKRSDDGSFLFDENGKIKKGPNYFKPNLTPFLKK